MIRKKIEELALWKENPLRKPLIIQGARQVGKTWLMKKFGATYFKKCVYINFDESTRLQSIFSDDFPCVKFNRIYFIPNW
jgi:predicted AAA+ superfamily ATPase